MNKGTPLNYVLDFYNQAVKQLKSTVNANEQECSIKVGLMILYFWASVYNNNETKEKIKMEGENLLLNAAEFFEQADFDFENLKKENHPIINNLEQLTMDDYNNLIDFFQKGKR